MFFNQKINTASTYGHTYHIYVGHKIKAYVKNIYLIYLSMNNL